MGWQNVFHCENNAFCRRILNHYWPHANSYEKIQQFNATQYRGSIDIISAGFPCQPFSLVGKRKGKNDDRYLWPEARRVIMEAQPLWIVLENVAGLFSVLEPESLSEMEYKETELFCPDGKHPEKSTILRLQRRVIGSIVSEIETAGYILPTLEDGTPILLCIPACAVNAPHRRDRIWFIAHSKYAIGQFGAGNGTGAGGDRPVAHDHRPAWPDTNGNYDGEQWQERTEKIFTDQDRDHAQHDPCKIGHAVTDPLGKGLGGRSFYGDGQPGWGNRITDWENWPAQPPLRRRDDGVSAGLDGISFSKWNIETIKGYGNAIVPEVAFQLFQVIQGINQSMGFGPVH